MPKVMTWLTDDQYAYLSRMVRDLDIKNGRAVSLLIELGIARREEILNADDLLRVSANTLTLLRRMASAADPQLIKQSKADADTLIQSLKENNS